MSSRKLFKTMLAKSSSKSVFDILILQDNGNQFLRKHVHNGHNADSFLSLKPYMLQHSHDAHTNFKARINESFMDFRVTTPSNIEMDVFTNIEENSQYYQQYEQYL